MKISLEQANKLFSALPGDVVVVADDYEADTQADVTTIGNTILNALEEAMRPSLTEQMKPTLEAGFTGRYLGALRSAAQRVFNVHKRELEDMSIEQVLAKCKTFIDDLHKQELEGQQLQHGEIMEQGNNALQQLRDNYEQQLLAERNRYTQRDIAARCAQLLHNLPRKGGDLQEQADMLRYKMATAYELQYNEEKAQLEFYKDGKPVLNEKNEPLTDEAFAQLWAAKAGILVSDTRHIKPADVLAGTQGQYAGGVAPVSNNNNAPGAMEAISAWAEEN
ncbi:MAG: hypothetical protein EOP51_04025 [Sphingobacteriales bacterium]|nr:MAG: hypothetical protein EOP51_04025 [Sphingobacteriales bacterium]